MVICQKGLKLSHGVAALLRDAGIPAEVLEGGYLAWEKCRPAARSHQQVAAAKPAGPYFVGDAGAAQRSTALPAPG
jgi:hypothetical protein